MRVLSLLIVILAAACGAGAAATRTPAVATGMVPTTAATTGTGGPPTAAQLCSFLTAADWGQFDYVTAAQPDVNGDPGSAVCGYANGLLLEVYADTREADAEGTFQTILDNAPFDGSQTLIIPGADEVQFDPQISDDSAGIAVRAGRVSFTIGLPSGDAAQAQAMALAGLVLARSAALQ